MKLKLILAAAVVAGASLAGTAGSAATVFNLVGGTPGTLPGDYNPTPSSLPDIGPGTAVAYNGALGLSGAGRVTFSYIGSEAGWHNSFHAGSGAFDNRTGGNAPFTLDFGAGTLPFSFKTETPGGTFANGSSTGSYGSLALFQKSPTLVYVLFNDASTSDRDYDDLVVQMSVEPVPLPAAGLLLVAALGGLGALSRRRSTGAA